MFTSFKCNSTHFFNTNQRDQFLFTTSVNEATNVTQSSVYADYTPYRIY